MKTSRSLPLIIALLAILAPSIALADGIDGVLTADVYITLPSIFNGDTFCAVINPDASHPDKIGPTNTSGIFIGSYLAPSSFAYVELPVYAIVDANGDPWDQGSPLFPAVFDGENMFEDMSTPLFNLLHVGDLDLNLSENMGLYMATGVFHDIIEAQDIDLEGSLIIETPPSGAPNYLWYGVPYNSVVLGDDLGTISFGSSDESWASGWPGATLDKNFFPYVPEPATLSLLALALIPLSRRRAA